MGAMPMISLTPYPAQQLHIDPFLQAKGTKSTSLHTHAFQMHAYVTKLDLVTLVCYVTKLDLVILACEDDPCHADFFHAPHSSPIFILLTSSIPVVSMNYINRSGKQCGS